MCSFKVDICLNRFEHVSHSYDVSPVWILMCCFIAELSLNRFAHVSHS